METPRDIDEAAIATAREGLYTLNDAADVSPERLLRWAARYGLHEGVCNHFSLRLPGQADRRAIIERCAAEHAELHGRGASIDPAALDLLVQNLNLLPQQLHLTPKLIPLARDLRDDIPLLALLPLLLRLPRFFFFPRLQLLQFALVLLL